MRGFGLGIAATAAAGLLVAGYAAAQTSETARLAQARQQSAAAAARAAQLEAEAGREKNAARRAQAEEAAVAAKIDQAAADIAAGQARIALLDRLLADQRARLAARQGPVTRLLAALQSMASRPAIVSLAQPGSVDDMVHVRAVLASAMPVIRARTSAIRADVARSRLLRNETNLASTALGASRVQLEGQRLTLARLEAAHRGKALALGRGALAESDRAIALGERARDLVDRMGQAGSDAATAADLIALPGPAVRAAQPGDAAATASWPGNPPYRLPVAGRIVTGLGELSDAGVRSRGLTIAAQPRAEVVAPAAGRIAYAAPFRDYGTIVIIDHGGGWTSLISGLGDVAVRDGDRVRQGDTIGTVTTQADPRLTVELRRRDRAIDMTPLIG